MKHFQIIFVYLIIFQLNWIYSNGDSNIDFEYPLISCVQKISNGNHASCFYQLLSTFWRFHDWSDESERFLCQYSCFVSFKGRISKMEWIWDAKFRCPSKAPFIEGFASRTSRTRAIEWAINDFISNALSTGQFDPKEFDC